MTVPADVEAVVAATLSTHGRIDVLINNAGYGLYGPAELGTEEQLWRQLDTNTFGAWRMITAVLPAMRRRGRGKIVNVTSLSGRIVAPMLAHYAATKFALEALGEGLRFEVGALGVQVCTVEPGMYASDWQTSNLDVVDGVAGGPYESLVAERLDGFRRLAATRPGSASVAAALADIVDLAQPLPMRWPVGYEATRDVAIRASRSDEEWDSAAAQRRPGSVATAAAHGPAGAGRARLVDRERRGDHRRLARLRRGGRSRAGPARQHRRRHDAHARARRAGGRRRLRGPHPPGAPRRHRSRPR